MAHVVCCPPSKAALLLLCLLPHLAAAAPSEEELFFKSVSEVSDGDLRFLERAPERPVHHHENRLTIHDASLVDGWIRLEQCHSHLDPVASMQIVYGEGRIRALEILNHHGIGKTWVLGHTVQLEDVAPGAGLCIRAETRALARDEQGNYQLANGPYMRRFLDGFYPMRVSVDVNLDTDRLGFLDITPAPQPGFLIQQDARHIRFDALFEGMLRTLIRFRPRP